jgi:hypothetical protein
MGARSLPAVIAIALAACSPGGGSEAPSSALAEPGIVAEVVSYQLVAHQPGRLIVALLTPDNSWLSFGQVGLRFSYLGDGASGPPAPAAHAPVTATFLAIPGTPEGTGRRPTLTLPADGRGVYAAEPITFDTAGYWTASASGTLGDGSSFTADAAFRVLDHSEIVTVGSPAPRSENAVIGDPGVPDSAIDSRAVGGQPIPDPELHRTTIAAAIARGHPALVVFSTPVYCVSRFCGPVTDMIGELAATYADRAEFIHVEIYRDFEAGTINQTAADWLLTDSGELREPWTFLIGADGRIAGSWDTVVTRSELEPLLAALPPMQGP